MRMTDIKNKIHELIESAYRMGYEDGKNLEYDLGLNDAWECARKMMLSDEDGGIALSDILKIFGMTQYSAIKRFSASEAIAKIKEYEEKQKRTCDTCQYGGHTLQDLRKCVYCDGRYYWTPKQTEQCCKSVMTLDESIKWLRELKQKKTDERRRGMTREEAIKWLTNIKDKFIHGGDEAFDNARREAIDMAIKALEQEPCDDCVRRQAVLDAIAANCTWENEYNLTSSRIKKAVEDLPPVTPQPKPGRWIEHFDESGKWYECDQCHTDWGGPVNYCPNCGAKMEGDKR